MEYVKCNICREDDTKFMFYVRDRNSREKKLFKLVKCRRCGFVYLNPRPDKEEIKKYYPPWYHYRVHTKVVNIEKTKTWEIPWRDTQRVCAIVLWIAAYILPYGKEWTQGKRKAAIIFPVLHGKISCILWST